MGFGNRARSPGRRKPAGVLLWPGLEKDRLEAVVGGNIHRGGRVNFALSVGTRIPDSIEVYTLPETIVDIVPQYRGFRYIVAENELIIVDPDTLEIVAVLPV